MRFIFMAQSHVLSVLIDKRSELMGLIDVKRKELEQLNQGLVSIDGTIKLFDPEFKASSVQAKTFRQRNQYFTKVEIPRLIMNYMRGTEGKLQSVILSHLLALKGLDDSKAHDLNSSISKALMLMLKNGQIERTRTPSGNFWKLS
jgi:hypothetical protein